MAYKEKRLNKTDIEAVYYALGSDPNGGKTKNTKEKKPKTVKRTGNKKTAAKKK